MVMEKKEKLIAEIKTETGTSIVSIELEAKNFKTGSRGYYAIKKLAIDGLRYQMQIQLVEIGSKKQKEEN